MKQKAPKFEIYDNVFDLYKNYCKLVKVLYVNPTNGGKKFKPLARMKLKDNGGKKDYSTQVYFAPGPTNNGKFMDIDDDDDEKKVSAQEILNTFVSDEKFFENKKKHYLLEIQYFFLHFA